MADRTWRWPGLLGQDDRRPTSIAVIGLGRFGSSVAETAVELGAEVLGIDRDPSRVAEHAAQMHHVVEADTTSRRTLEKLGVHELDVAVVAIGSDLEASILTTAALIDLEHPNIVAKALSNEHGRILERIGAHEVVFPERDMGRRIGHRVAGRVMDWFEFDPTLAVAETQPPPWLIGVSLADARLRAEHGVTVVFVGRGSGGFVAAEPSTVIAEGDVMLVAGGVAQVEEFCSFRS